MKKLLIALFIWSFFGQWATGAWASFAFLVPAITMLLASLLCIAYFKSFWWTLSLFVSFPLFYYRLSILLHTSFSLPIDAMDLTLFSLGLTVVSFISILTAKYLPKWI